MARSRSLVCIAAALAAATLCVRFLAHPGLDLAGVLNVTWTITSLWAAVSCFRTSRLLTESSPRRAWLLTSAACTSWFLGQLLWDFQEWFRGQRSPFAGWQDVAFVTAGPLLLVAFHFFSDRKAHASLARKACNLGIIACSAAVIAILLCGHSLLARHGDPAFLFSVLAWGILMPTAFVGGLLYLWLYCGSDQLRSLTLLVIAAGVEAVANIQYAYACAVERYRPGMLGDWLFLGGFLLIIWASVAARKSPRAESASPRRRVRFDQLEPALPAFCMLSMLTVAIWHHDGLDDLFPYLLPLLLLLGLCIAIREAWSSYAEKRLNEQLRSSEAMLRQVVDSNLGGIFFADPKGGITYANDKFLQMVGYTREELSAKLLQWRGLAAPEYFEQEKAALSQLETDGRCEPFERNLRRRDGTEIPVLIGAALLPGEERKIVCFAADLSARKQTERALEETKARLTAALDHLPFAFWAMDEEWRYTYQNVVSLERWGDQRGRRPDETEHPDALVQQRMASYARAFAGELVKEDTTSGEGEAQRWYQRIIVPIRQDSKVCGIFGVNVDLTEQKQMQLQLQESEARYRTLAEHSAVGIWQLDAEGRTLYANRNLLALLGLERCSDLLGRSCLDFLALPDRERWHVEATKRRAFLDSTYEVELLPQGGADPVPVLVSGVSMRSSDGKFAGSLATLTNLTELKRTQEALHVSERRFRALVENASDGTAAWDRDGIICYAAPSNSRLLGYTPEEMLNKNVAEFLHPEDALNLAETLALATRIHGAHLPLQGRVRHKDGRWRYCEGLLTNLLDDPAVAALVLNYDDCTERHEAEEALRLSEERYRSLIDGARDAIFTLSPEGLLTSLNPAAELITGIPNAERLGKPFLPLIPPEDTARAWEAFQKTLAGERFPTLELNIYSARGQVLFEFTVTPQYEGDRIIGVLGIGRDITERRALEEQLRHSQKMESVGQLAGGVAHDFNNLLTVIQGNASLVELEPNLSPSIATSIQEITAATDRAASLTRQLLTFSRRQIIRPRNLDLNEVIGDLTKMLRRILGEDITLHFESCPKLPQIHADSGMIEQVLLNLAVNARDAMPAGGNLMIRTASVQLGEQDARKMAGARQGSFVRITVKDSGCGISVEDLPHVFEPFFTTKDVGKGTGLGLATVYGIVQQHEGWIVLESTRGEGTCFDIYVPSATPRMEDKPASAPPAATMPRGTETILVVEDEAPLRSMVRVVLSRLGYNVIEAASGVEALDVWRQHQDQIDLVFTDMVMPDGLSGQQLAEKLQTERPGTRVLFTSGYSAQMLARNGRLPNGAPCLQKPYMPPTLANAIRQAITAPAHEAAA